MEFRHFNVVAFQGMFYASLVNGMLRESIKRELDSHQMQINERKGDDLRLWDMFDKGGKHDKP